jgi:Domain of unknown function (DUF4232)
MRAIKTTFAVVVLVSSAAGCASSTLADGGHGYRGPCTASALVLRPGTPVSPMTGEHAVSYALTNRGSVACTVRGYPRITLFDARGQALPFRYANGGGTYVTSRKPVTVVLAPGASSYIGVAKYRCDLGIARTAAAIRLALPAARGQVFIAREPVGVSGTPGLSYCRGGPYDPGQLVTVSPIERTQLATSSLR